MTLGCNCGSSRKQLTGNFVAPQLNVAGMMPLADALEGCEPYHGAFQGTYFHIVGANTDDERLFLRNNRRDAVAYSKAHGNAPITNLVSARSLCHDRVIALLGA